MNFFIASNGDTSKPVMVPANFEVSEISRTQVNLGACDRGLMQFTIKMGNVRYTLTTGLCKRLVGGTVMLRVAAVRASCMDGSFQSDGFVLEGSPIRGGMRSHDRDIARLANKNYKAPAHMRNALQVLGGYFNSMRLLGILQPDGTISGEKLARFFQAETTNLIMGAYLKDALTGFPDLMETLLGLNKPTELMTLRELEKSSWDSKIQESLKEAFLNLIDVHINKNDRAWVTCTDTSPGWEKGFVKGNPFKIKEATTMRSFTTRSGRTVDLDNVDVIDLTRQLIEHGVAGCPFGHLIMDIFHFEPNEAIVGIPLGTSNAMYLVTPWFQGMYGPLSGEPNDPDWDLDNPPTWLGVSTMPLDIVT